MGAELHVAVGDCDGAACLGKGEMAAVCAAYSDWVSGGYVAVYSIMGWFMSANLAQLAFTPSRCRISVFSTPDSNLDDG